MTETVGTNEAFYTELAENHYSPLWQLMGGLDSEAKTNLVPHIWRYEQARELMMKAGEVVPLEDALRRVLGFRNPGSLPHQRTGATDSLWAALQLVKPGEIAPSHRHTPSALRFIVEGNGAYTVVNGQRVPMEVGDFLLTPSLHWHEHGHEGEGPMIWLDGLDSPLMSRLNQYIIDEAGGTREVEKPMPGAYLQGMLGKNYGEPHQLQQPLVYKLADALEALEYLRDDEPDPYDDIIVEYKNPTNGGPVMTTISAYLQLIRPGVDTKSHRHTHSTVYHVVSGSGYSIVDGKKIEWVKGDTLAIPLWYEHSHHNHSGEDAVLFSYTDRPAITALGLWREQGE
ncbi:cupin domain-containing protein [Glutamicibacter uratoxydans]|uniref:cupin domain-containing protein n=1 Tax=Glutamicibacter uratoxydans TaxID=43667 RepID=UPI003D6DC373